LRPTSDGLQRGSRNLAVALSRAVDLLWITVGLLGRSGLARPWRPAYRRSAAYDAPTRVTRGSCLPAHCAAGPIRVRGSVQGTATQGLSSCAMPRVRPSA